jgi:hypothetical protein
LFSALKRWASHHCASVAGLEAGFVETDPTAQERQLWKNPAKQLK